MQNEAAPQETAARPETTAQPETAAPAQPGARAQPAAPQATAASRKTTAARKTAAPRKAATPRKRAAPGPKDTLAFDIGGTGIKASVLAASGTMEHARVRIDTPYPLSPTRLVEEMLRMVTDLPSYDRISVGFPGMVRGGHVLSAPHFISPDGPGGKPAPKLVKAWDRFDLEGTLEKATGKPAKVANDADVQGAAVVTGKGFEAVMTLGTGVGTAFFLEGKLLPHFEFAHHPLRKSGTYNDVLGNATLKKVGTKRWQKRVLDAIATFKALTFYDHLFIGGGNAARLSSLRLPSDVSLVDNTAGILGGIKLWERI